MSNIFSMENAAVTPQSKITYIEPALGAFCRPGKCSLTQELRRLEAELEHAREELAERDAVVAALQAELEHQVGMLRKLRLEVYGERKPSPKASSTKEQPNAEQEAAKQQSPSPGPKKKGGQPGHPGRGRKIPDHLPIAERIHKPRPEDLVCNRCGSPYEESGLTEDSHEITVKVQFEVIRHKRKRCFKTCDCPQTPASVTAAPPPKVVPKGLYTHAFLALVLTWKYGFQIALGRIASMFSMDGLDVHTSTLSEIFKKLQPLLIPLYTLLQTELQEEQVLRIDETGFRHFDTAGRMTFTEVEVQPRKLAWLWVFSGERVVFFVVDPSRSSSVLTHVLGHDLEATIVSDGAGAYRKFTAQSPGITQARCWAHLQRHFEDAAKAFPSLQAWSDQWVGRCSQIFALRDQRTEALTDPEMLPAAQQALEEGIAAFHAVLVAESKEPSLHDEQCKVLTSAIKYWPQYTVFVWDPRVPMTNNEAEQALRSGAYARQNWLGVHAEWSGHFAAMMMTFIQTATKHQLNAKAYLEYVLDRFARYENGPYDLRELLPWNIPAEIRVQYNMEPRKGSP